MRLNASLSAAVDRQLACHALVPSTHEQCCCPRVQLADYDEAKRAGLKRVDTLERANSSASLGAQQYESQVAGLRQQVRDAQAAARLAESDRDKVRLLQGNRVPALCGA